MTINQIPLTPRFFELDSEQRIAVNQNINRIASEPYVLQCYGCLLYGGLNTFTLRRVCPDCGSLEVHSPEAHDNWKSA